MTRAIQTDAVQFEERIHLLIQADEVHLRVVRQLSLGTLLRKILAEDLHAGSDPHAPNVNT